MSSGSVARSATGSVHTASVIRLGTLADYPAVAAVFRRASLFNDGDRDDLLAHPEHLVLQPDALEQGRTYVAEEQESVVGFASWVKAAETVDLEDLFVEPTWMRQGVATALVARLVDVLRSQGISCLEVTANPHAIGFYRRAGFHDIGTAMTAFGQAPRMALAIV
jgi:GNAT superfamily N-acetyltransferase